MVALLRAQSEPIIAATAVVFADKNIDGVIRLILNEDLGHIDLFVKMRMCSL